jgi:AraC family transcriptional regulator, regulatory protein of adaptative response / methylated-DNA-[protein]-cysteine methyltransferase
MQRDAGADALAKPVDFEMERRWRAVLERDADADGRFVYAVETTTIYCRPSCPSRRPLRKNVRFLASAADAERQGYRACLRCRPTEALAPAEAVVARVQALLQELQVPPTLAELGRRLSLSPSYLQRLFKRHTGLSPKAYLDARKFEQLKGALRTERDGVSAAIYAAGYQAPSRAYEKTRARLGMTPSAYQRGGVGQRVAYAVAKSSLGRTLVASTRQGVCRVAFGDSKEVLLQQLRAEYPKAELVPAGAKELAWVQEVVRTVDAPWKSPRVPLDLHGTAFQLQVWKALQRIPAGETASYAEVARAVAAPRAVRAVARACASNKAAVLVPCHRVVHTGGAVGGYRWGVARKKRLLESEARGTSTPFDAPDAGLKDGASEAGSTRRAVSRSARTRVP